MFSTAISFFSGVIENKIQASKKEAAFLYLSVNTINSDACPKEIKKCLSYFQKKEEATDPAEVDKLVDRMNDQMDSKPNSL